MRARVHTKTIRIRARMYSRTHACAHKGTHTGEHTHERTQAQAYGMNYTFCTDELEDKEIWGFPKVSLLLPVVKNAKNREIPWEEVRKTKNSEITRELSIHKK